MGHFIEAENDSSKSKFAYEDSRISFFLPNAFISALNFVT